jgi:hypothetical protein
MTGMSDVKEYQPDDKLRRIEAALALSALGFPVTYNTLTQAAVERRGPPYTKFGKYTLYRWGDLIAWAKSEMRPAHVETR